MSTEVRLGNSTAQRCYKTAGDQWSNKKIPLCRGSHVTRVASTFFSCLHLVFNVTYELLFAASHDTNLLLGNLGNLPIISVLSVFSSFSRFRCCPNLAETFHWHPIGKYPQQWTLLRIWCFFSTTLISLSCSRTLIFYLVLPFLCADRPHWPICSAPL